MIGGLSILVNALKELLTEQRAELMNRVILTDLAVHIVQALSAAIFTHGMSCYLLSYKVKVVTHLQLQIPMPSVSVKLLDFYCNC